MPATNSFYTGNKPKNLGKLKKRAVERVLDCRASFNSNSNKMNLICQKKRPNSSHVSPAPKMSRVTSTNVPPLPQMARCNNTSTNRFVAPLSLRHSLQANRVVVPSLSQTSQSPNTSIPPTRKNGTQSTIETNPTCSDPLIETLRTHTQPEAPSRTLSNPGAQYGHSSDNLDRPPSSHPGCEQGSGVLVSNMHMETLPSVFLA
ncbi:Uncharacterized protein Fot_42315 [Forsythia ovata]|uniref:Uncharacterized protein n=1 Tax=Forsythia ovata TaxID=205694 RepID=A0ABD1RMM2_9LAMI